MKNFNLYRKCISVFLSLLIVIFSFYHSYFISYANSNEDKQNIAWEIGKDVLSYFEDAGSYSMWLASQLGAVVTRDFENFIKNNENLKNYWKNKYITSSDDNDGNNEKYITINQYTNEITYSKDFIKDFKQALQEYSEETNGFWLMPTTSIRALNPQHFEYKNSYISLQNLINNHGIIACQMSLNTSWDPSVSGRGYKTYLAADFSEYISSDYSFVCINGSGYSPYDTTSAMAISIYDSGWSQISNIDKYVFGDDIYTNISDGSKFRTGYSYFYVNYPNYNNGILYRCPESNNTNLQGYGMLISKDGCRIRVFKSINAMKGYDTGTRTVYFGSDFYEKEPTEITITIDDLDKYLNTDFDKYFKDLHDAIISQGSNLSEEDIEKIVDRLLGKLADIDDNIGNVGDSVQESNNLLSQILAKLDNLDKNVESILLNIDNKVSSTLDFTIIEERLDLIIEYLKKIGNWTIIDTILDGVDLVDDYVDFIKDLISDAEGVADTALGTLLNALDGGTSLLSKKFPFSVPWDLLFFITILASDPEVPHFEIPIDFDISALDINVHYDFVVDFTDFQFLSDISRTLLSMTYCVGLIKLTTGIVSIKKEE